MAGYGSSTARTSMSCSRRPAPAVMRRACFGTPRAAGVSVVPDVSLASAIAPVASGAPRERLPPGLCCARLFTADRALCALRAQHSDVLRGQGGRLVDGDDLDPLRPVLAYVIVAVEGRVVAVVELVLPAIATPDRDAVTCHIRFDRARHVRERVLEMPAQGDRAVEGDGDVAAG